MKYGGIFVIGEDNVIRRNRLLNLNTAHCGCYYTAGEPDMFRSGIYLGRGAERPAPARGNRVEENEITGYQMDSHCIGMRARHSSRIGIPCGGIGAEDSLQRGDAEKARGTRPLLSSPRLPLRLCASALNRLDYFCALNVSIAFSIWRSWPPRKSAGVLST